MLTAADPSETPAAAPKRVSKTYGRKREPESNGADGDDAGDATAANPDSEKSTPSSPPIGSRRDSAVDKSLHDVASDDILSLLRESGPETDNGHTEKVFNDELALDSPPPVNETRMEDASASRLLFLDDDMGLERDAEILFLDDDMGLERDAEMKTDLNIAPEAGREPRELREDNVSAFHQASSPAKAPSPDASSSGIGGRKKSARTTADSEGDSAIASERDASLAKPRSTIKKRKLLKKKSKAVSASSSDFSSESDLENPETVLLTRPKSAPSSPLATQPLDPDMDLRLHFSDDENIDAKLAKDEERAERLRQEMPMIDFDKEEEELPATPELPAEEVGTPGEDNGGEKKRKLRVSCTMSLFCNASQSNLPAPFHDPF
jgi:hypothetical protein